MDRESSVKQSIVALCHQLYEKGFVVANDGNVSIREGAGIYVTGAGTYFARMDESQVVKVNESGEISSGGPSGVRPTSEIAMHLEVYRRRKEIRAVIHAHSPYATAFSMAGRERIDCMLTEMRYTLGSVPIAPFARPGTEEVPLSIRDLVKDHDALILSNHGVVTLGRSLDEAYWNLERVEHFARVCYLALTLKKGNRS
ncbi:MAG: class II aldolase/adducin family protein [Fidelibacterota bacterium]